MKLVDFIRAIQNNFYNLNKDGYDKNVEVILNDGLIKMEGTDRIVIFNIGEKSVKTFITKDFE